MVAASSFGQGQVSFKTSLSKNAVYSATDNTSGSLALVPTSGTVGSFGAVTYEIFTAANGTAAPTLSGGTLNFSAAWTGSIVANPVYSGAGVVSPAITITLPAASGAAGNAVEMVIVAYTGSLASPSLYGYSGDPFPVGSSVATANGLVEWSQGTGNPNKVPTPDLPSALLTGATGFGSLVLTPVPEPSTIALGGLGAAALLLFRRRK